MIEFDHFSGMIIGNEKWLCIKSSQIVNFELFVPPIYISLKNICDLYNHQP